MTDLSLALMQALLGKRPLKALLVILLLWGCRFRHVVFEFFDILFIVINDGVVCFLRDLLARLTLVLSDAA